MVNNRRGGPTCERSPWLVLPSQLLHFHGHRSHVVVHLQRITWPWSSLCVHTAWIEKWFPSMFPDNLQEWLRGCDWKIQKLMCPWIRILLSSAESGPVWQYGTGLLLMWGGRETWSTKGKSSEGNSSGGKSGHWNGFMPSAKFSLGKKKKH